MKKEGYADLENYHEMVMRHGDICTLLPNDIHKVHNEGTCRRSRCISTDAAWPSRTATNSIRR